MTTTTNRPEVIIRVSEPYHTVGYQGGRYGRSQFAKRDYSADHLGRHFTNTSRVEIQRAIRAAQYRETGSDRVSFLVLGEGVCAYSKGALVTMEQCSGMGCKLCAAELDEQEG